jgi:hypothetical protein
MSTEVEPTPQIVKSLAQQHGLSPMRWTITDAEIIILCHNGQKFHFPRPALQEQSPAGIAAPVRNKRMVAPKIQKAPVKPGRKS